MTRIVTTAAAILILTIAIGCESNTGRSQIMAQRTNPYTETAQEPPSLDDPSMAGQIDLVENMTMHRQAYRKSLLALIQHYDATGNHQKATWAKEELTALDRIPMYAYIVELPSNLKATDRIQAADDLFQEAEKVRRDAGVLPRFKNEETLRVALGKYNQVIQKYPKSDKIDDAAFRMGEIQEYFSDFTLALTSYQRAYQWDPATLHPARFRAANILDRKLHRRAEALELYQEAIIKESQHTDWRATAERRVQELNTGSN